MKIELLTQDQYNTLLSIYNNFPELTLQNKGYEGINKSALSDEAKEANQTVTDILKASVSGFSSFSNFRLSKGGEIEIRLQYNYNYDSSDRPFYGVGYILLDELLNGFTVKES